MKTPAVIPPLVVAHNLVARMAQAAARAGDTGRAWVASGVQRLLGRELTVRRAGAAQAHAIAGQVHTAEDLLDAALAGDGVIDAGEAVRLRAALRKPERAAGELAATLHIPAGEPAP
jgi:hypothetical protein